MTFTTVERALQLARDGKHRTIAEIRKTLRTERFDAIEAYTSGKAFQAQLNAELAKHR